MKNGRHSTDKSAGAAPAFAFRCKASASTGLGVLQRQLAVPVCVGPLFQLCLSAEFPLDAGWCSHHQGPWRNITGDNSTCGNKGACADGDPVEHNRADPHQTAVFQGGSMDHRHPRLCFFTRPRKASPPCAAGPTTSGIAMSSRHNFAALALLFHVLSVAREGRVPWHTPGALLLTMRRS